MAFFPALGPGISKNTTPGHIYFIQGTDGGPIKIGWATKPEVRMAQMQSHCPVTLCLLYNEPGSGREEMALHKRFSAHRLHGEWFAPAEELLAEIAARKAAYVPPQPKPKPAPATSNSSPPPHLSEGQWAGMLRCAKALE